MSAGPVTLFVDLIAAMVGILLAIAGGWWFARRVDLRRNGRTATVTVTGYNSRRDFDGQYDWYHALVDYGGRTIRLSMGERHQRWPVGTRLTTRFREGEVDRMVVDQAGFMMFMPVMVMLLGIGFVAFAFV